MPRESNASGVNMRAKLWVTNIVRQSGRDDLTFAPVSGTTYGPQGENEDNTFARYTPSAALAISVANPDLLGRFEPGQRFYVDFTEVA